jgi:hypothetical protein
MLVSRADCTCTAKLNVKEMVNCCFNGRAYRYRDQHSISNNDTGTEYTNLSAETVDMFCSSRGFSGSAPGNGRIGLREMTKLEGLAGWLATSGGQRQSDWTPLSSVDQLKLTARCLSLHANTLVCLFRFSWLVRRINIASCIWPWTTDSSLLVMQRPLFSLLRAMRLGISRTCTCHEHSSIPTPPPMSSISQQYCIIARQV